MIRSLAGPTEQYLLNKCDKLKEAEPAKGIGRLNGQQLQRGDNYVNMGR